jgi:gliding motility-associated-like protein
MNKFYAFVLLFFVLINNKALGQCPVINGAIVNSCSSGTGEGVNEFVVFTTTASATASAYTLYYGSNNPPTTGPTGHLSGLDISAKTGTGNFTGCTIIEVTSPATTIPSGSTIIFIPADFDQQYDISGLCSGSTIYIVYINRTGGHSTWAAGGVLANTPAGNRYIQIINGASTCTSNIRTYDNGWSSNSDGNAVWWDNSGTATYNNHSCSTIVPPASQTVTITPSTPVTICPGAATASMAYTVTGSPDEYSITWNAAAHTAGFTDLVNAALPASPITINIPPGAQAGTTYTGSLVVTNTSATSSSTPQNISIIIDPAATTQTTDTSGCNNVLFNSTTYTNSTVLHDTLRNSNGCDSVYKVTNITVTHITPVTQIIDTSGCNSVLYNGITYTSPAVLHDTLRSIGGCDSVYKIINITPVIPVTQTNNLSGCNSVVYNSITYTSSTIVHDTLRSTAGCDSVYKITNITVTTITPVTQPTNLSGCGSVIYNNITYTSPTVVHDTLRSIGGCDSVYKIATITVNPAFALNLTASLNPVNNGQTVTLTTSSVTSPYTVTSWDPANVFTVQNNLSQILIADTTTHIRVIAQSNNCADTASLLLVVNTLNTDFFVPNAFSPNANGNNDFFKVYGTTIQKAQIDIFNQWGQLIFEGDAVTPGWDGTYKGVQQPVGVYIYVVNATMTNGQVIETKGSFNLIR